jgi:hypothetical protein
MKRYLLFFLLLIAGAAGAQAPNIIYGKDVIISTRDTSSAELTILNNSRNVLGFFKNIGGGKGQYRLLTQADVTGLSDSLLARYTKTQADARFKAIGWFPTWSEVTSKPTNFSTTYALSNDVQDSILNRLRKSNNLSDLTNVSTARANLSVYSISNVDALLAGKLSATITSPATGNLIRYNGTNWVNWSPNFLTSYTETDPIWTAASSNYWLGARVSDSLTAVQSRIQTKQPLLGYTPLQFSDSTTLLAGRWLPNRSLDTATALQSRIQTKQNILVSGTNIKTVNGTNLLGSGDVTIISMIYPGAGIPVSTGTAWGTSITDNSSNWNTAFSWGNHASAGYSTASNTQTFTNKTWNGVAIADTYISSAATWNAKESALTFSTGLSRVGNTITNTITQYTDALARAAHSFTAGSGAYNSTTGVITIPTNTNQLTNGAGFITGITSGNVTTALGYTPYNATNPSGYITSSSLTSYLPLVGGTMSGSITSTLNGYGLIINRAAVTNYNGISYQTAGSAQWLVGLRENLSSNNYVIYNENGTDALTINKSTNAATFISSVTATTIQAAGIGLNATPSSNGIGATYARWLNTGGDLYIGVESSTAGGFFTGSSAYANVFYSSQPYQFIIGSTKRFEITSSGASVTGTISATNLSGTNTGDNAPNSLYSGLVSNATHTGDATGSTALTVSGLRGVALPTLGASAGFLRYTGTGTNTWVFDNSTYLTSITSSNVTTALGYTPYNASNPSGYLTSAVTSILGSSNQINVSASTGAVTLSLPSTIQVTTIQASSIVQLSSSANLTFIDATKNGRIRVSSGIMNLVDDNTQSIGLSVNLSTGLVSASGGFSGSGANLTNIPYSALTGTPTIPTNANYVDLTTTQTVGGAKNFSNNSSWSGTTSANQILLGGTVNGAGTGAHGIQLISTYNVGSGFAISVRDQALYIPSANGDAMNSFFAGGQITAASYTGLNYYAFRAQKPSFNSGNAITYAYYVNNANGNYDYSFYSQGGAFYNSGNATIGGTLAVTGVQTNSAQLNVNDANVWVRNNTNANYRGLVLGATNADGSEYAGIKYQPSSGQLLIFGSPSGFGGNTLFKNNDVTWLSVSASNAISFTGVITASSDITATRFISTTNGYGLTINRSAVTNYNGISYQTASAAQWFVGLRENLSSNNYVIYSEVGFDALTLNKTSGAATFYNSVTATAFYESSDIRQKTVHETLLSADGIDPIQYTFNPSGADKWGYSAQQVRSILPYAVTEGSDGFLKLDYTTVHTYKIAQLEKRIAELEKMVNAKN